MTNIKLYFLSALILSFFVVISIPSVVADPPSSGEIVAGSGGRLQPAGAGSPYPSETGLTPPFTHRTGPDYVDANGTPVVLGGPDSAPQFQFENNQDRIEANDAEWQKHKGKWMGSYEDWVKDGRGFQDDLKQYGGGGDLWGDFDAFETAGAQNMGSMNMGSGNEHPGTTITTPGGGQAVATGEGGH